jgi:hypothetical protein
LSSFRRSHATSLEMSFRLSFQRSFDASFAWSFEASVERSNELSFETSDERSDVTSFEMSDGMSDEVCFRVSVLRYFPADSETSLLTSFRGSNEERDEGGKWKADGESSYRPRYGAGLLRKSVVSVSNALMPVASTASSMSNRSEWFIAVMPRSGLPPPRNRNMPGRSSR